MEESVLEQSLPMTGESLNTLASEDYSCPPSKMIGDQAVILPDSNVDPSSFIMKGLRMEEVVLGGNQVNQLFNFNDAVRVPQFIIKECNAKDLDGGVILVPYSMIKQEDILEETEVAVSSNILNEGIFGNNMCTQFDPCNFVISSSIDTSTEQKEDTGFEDNKLIVDTKYNIQEPPSVHYNCGLCDDSFISRILLKNHINSNHANFQEKKCKFRYRCTSCSYSSRRRDKLDRHMEKHVLLDGVFPCGRKRCNPQTLPLRYRYNAEEYKCPDCQYACTVYKALKKHQKIHVTGVEQYSIKLSCKICGKDRATKNDMQRHMKKHRNNESFLCDLCNFSSVQLKKIIQHRRVHTGEKPHLCPHCSYRSARRDNLRSHVRRMHKRENMYIDTFNPNEDTPLSLTY